MTYTPTLKSNPFDWIAQDCDAIEKRLSNMGFLYPSAEIFCHWGGHLVSLQIQYRGTEYSTSESKWFQYDKGDDGAPQDIFEKAFAYIATLDTPQTVARQAFQRKLGRLIDEAKDIGLDVDDPGTPNIFDMLTVTMKELSENILTDQREKTDAVS